MQPNQTEYAFRQQKMYGRPMRTATLSRKSQFPLNQLLLNQRWQNPLEGIQETANILPVPPQPEFTYGANFNTDFNSQFDPRPKEIPTVIKMDEKVSSKKSVETVAGSKPRRPLNKSFPYRMFRKMRPSVKRQKSKRDLEYMPPSNLIRLFGETSLPGVRDIALSRSFLRRIFWIISFFFFGFLALRDISQLVSEYANYPITVDVRLRDSRRLPFPAVTVCNINMVRFSALCVTNVSRITDSMIPRDLREKLCGLQPAVATAAKEAMPGAKDGVATPVASTVTTMKPPVAKPPSTLHSANAKKAQQPHTSPKSTKKTTKTTNTTPTSRTKAGTVPVTTTAASTDSDNGLDDINNYAVSKQHKVSGNQTNANGTTEMDTGGGNSTAINELLNGTTTPSTIASSTTPMPAELPNDISMPIPESEPTERKERTKRRVGANEKSPKGNLTNWAQWGTGEPTWNMNSTNATSSTSQASNQQSPMGNNNNNNKPSPKSGSEKIDKNEKNDNSGQNQPAAQIPLLLENDIELTEREEKELQENLTNWLAVIYNSNEKIAQELGHQFEDFVLRCTIRSTNCTSSESFESFFTPTEGNCFTFTSQKLRKNSDRIKDETSIAGVNYGLELVLNLEISEYLTGTTQIGAIIMIQHPDEIGNSASEAIFIAPQQSTYIGLKMMNISRLPNPYPEDCIDHWPTALIGRLTQNASYSQQACLKICLQRTVHTRCKCQSAMLPQLELNSTLKICDTRRRSTRKCVEEVMFQAEEKVSTCKCPPRCQVINYDKTVSMARWPTREDKVTFDRGKANINFQNLAKVTVYFQTMTCQEVRQEKAYTTAKLFSSLGGILGMYVGFSFLSLFEILEVFVRRFWYFLTKKRSRFRTAVHTITATLALNPKRAPIPRKGFDEESAIPPVGMPMAKGRYPSRLNQPYHHGIV